MTIEAGVRWDVAIIDPPWPKKKGSIRKVRPKQSRTLAYETLSIPSIFELLDADVFSTAEDSHTVFLWVVDEFLHEAEEAMLARGYRRHARIIWDKQNGVAPAFSIRYCHEYLIWFYKPKFTPVAKAMRGKYGTVLTERSREHSRKPEGAYIMVEQLFPEAIKYDVFSRESRQGWYAYGDQPTYFNEERTDA